MSDASLELHDAGEQSAGMLPANSRSNVYENARRVKAGEGVLCGFTVYNSGAAQFIQIFDAPDIPATGSVPEVVFSAGATSTIGANWIPGRTFRRGIVICNSSTDRKSVV